jgi:hypothetical protein
MGFFLLLDGYYLYYRAAMSAQYTDKRTMCQRLGTLLSYTLWLTDDPGKLVASPKDLSNLLIINRKTHPARAVISAAARKQ